MITHQELRQKSNNLLTLAKHIRSTDPTSREEWETILEIETAARYLFSAAGWLEQLEPKS